MNTTMIKQTERQKADQAKHDKPVTTEEKLEAGLEDSMDASDPPCATAPGDHGDPVPSSGFPGKTDDRDRK